MLIANQKRKSNIAEYIIYMYQVEDTIRACKFDMDLIEKRIISQYSINDTKKNDIRNWYSDLILMMHEENITKAGHLSLISGIISELFELHKNLLHIKKDPKYLELFAWAMPNIKAFGEKLGKEKGNDIDVCFSALYGLLLTRLQKKQLSEETLHAMQTFSNLLAHLSSWFKKIEEGKAEI
ncbi:MAG: DUF4924 family protein [Bacteroidales bacterium]|nr:DUF4924 family protein [Bacteroidales bacterium]